MLFGFRRKKHPRVQEEPPMSDTPPPEVIEHADHCATEASQRIKLALDTIDYSLAEKRAAKASAARVITASTAVVEKAKSKKK